jgi:hypothetical protein
VQEKGGHSIGVPAFFLWFRERRQQKTPYDVIKYLLTA